MKNPIRRKHILSAAKKHERKPGGQPHNQNAIKHGFYSAIFKKTERALLSEIPLDDLSAEIELIRVTSQRFLRALVASKDELDFEAQLTALRAVNLSAHSLATLLRAQALGVAYRRDMAEATEWNQNASPSDI